MAQIALPRQQVTQAQAPQSAAVGSPLYQRRRQSNAGPIELLPNPDFTFPMRTDRTASEPSTTTLNARPMSLQAYPPGRRGSTPGRLRQKSVNTLPDFSFNPAAGASQPPAVPASPPHSPFTLSAPTLAPAPAQTTTPAQTTPSRPIGGHRRGGSEFIGGDARGGTTLSTSPGKGDGILPPPTQLRAGPPAGRRGHAHRRSGAVSSHDLTAIMKPANAPASSAPVTPDGHKFVLGHSVNKSMSQPSLRVTARQEDIESPPRPPSRARVGFSDKVEYIRPLSTISSETETSLSNFRGHSATNSLTSVISASMASPTRSSHRSLSPIKRDSRPSTAGAILDMQKIAHLGDDLTPRKRPSSAISLTPVASPTSPMIPAKRRSFFRLESRRSDNSVLTLSNDSDPMLSARPESPLPSPMRDNDSADDTDKAKSRKSNRTPRKVKSWASSIIPKKSKNSKKTKGRPLTPPPQITPDLDETDVSEDLDFDAIFDVDNTVTIVSPTDDPLPDAKPQADYASWQPREFKRVDSDIMSPVIDLDAALGPFNTPQGSSPRLSQRGFGAHRRAMHSAGGLLQPSHRRTESAPELVPFELRTLAVPTASTMADVFEEEEPDEHSSKSAPAVVSEQQEDIEEPKVQVVEADSFQNGQEINWNFNDGLGIKRSEKSCRAERREPDSPLTIEEEAPTQSSGNDVVEVVEDFEEPRTSSLTHSSDSTVTIPAPVDETKERQPVMNLSLPLPQQDLMTPDTITSSFSSPDYRSSQASFDTPRLGTAASSMTDYQAMPSPRFGEPGPELRISVDDVPSLTSSRSTMTSAMQNAFPMISPRQPGDRSSSLCSVPSESEYPRRKRSSIVSLSRLINNSSFTERSKLSHEVRPQSEYLEPTHKEKKKHRRLSKLMQFWKPKEASRT
ncbi:hypothetical protein P280DRAFT_215949 [Massarina eburnea CBS 473.64]|uniref:Cell wall proline rich protein n=1 Tax=Massarina eburnea CBS 473.64 TaxID=1395130 RepID=A0A6A6SA19_9PLEO|nr:hypothetical protein P280DRAFT_215949 [Massarina eburnea CBS 473.64]